MAKTIKRIDAGSLHVAIIYPRCSRADSVKVRAEKKKASTAAQAKLNKDYSFRKLEYLLACNFPTAGSGLFGTLTYDDKHLPVDRNAALRQFKYFLKLLRVERRSADLPEPVVFWSPEVLTSGRWHFHIVIDNTGHDMEMIRRCWIYGSDIELEKIKVEPGADHEALARYISKESRECQDYQSKPGLRGWSYTRNAKKPSYDVCTVPEDYELEVPEGAFVLEKNSSKTQWASYQVVKYSTAASFSKKTPRSRRRKKSV